MKLIEASDRDDLLARLATSFAGGTPPDVFLLNYRFYGQFAARGVIEPVQDRLEGSDAFEEEDFYPQALEAFRRDGELVCLPQNISSLVVYYNRDLFRRAGVAEPKSGWTWNDMVQKAIKLTRDEDGDGTSTSTASASSRRSSAWRPSCGRWGASSSTTNRSRPASRSTRPRRSGRCRPSSTFATSISSSPVTRSARRKTRRRDSSTAA